MDYAIAGVISILLAIYLGLRPVAAGEVLRTTCFPTDCF